MMQYSYMYQWDTYYCTVVAVQEMYTHLKWEEVYAVRISTITYGKLSFGHSLRM